MNLVEGYFQAQYPMAPVGYQPPQLFPYSQQQQLPQPVTYPQNFLPYYQQPNYYNYYYERNGPNYPVDPYQSSSNDGGYTVYNLRKNAQISPTVPAGFHVYEPARKSNVMGQSAVIRPNETNAEEILKKNPHLWNLYQSGRFEIVQMFDSKEKKIILKEKSYSSDPKYTVTKYKIPMSLNNSVSHGSSDDGHILLVSFSNEHIDPSQQIQIDSNHYVYEDVINRNYAHSVANPINY